MRIRAGNEDLSVKALTFEVGEVIGHGARADLGALTTGDRDPVVADRAV